MPSQFHLLLRCQEQLRLYYSSQRNPFWDSDLDLFLLVDDEEKVLLPAPVPAVLSDLCRCFDQSSRFLLVLLLWFYQDKKTCADAYANIDRSQPRRLKQKSSKLLSASEKISRKT